LAAASAIFEQSCKASTPFAFAHSPTHTKDTTMKYILLLILGIPLPIIVLIALFS